MEEHGASRRIRSKGLPSQKLSGSRNVGDQDLGRALQTREVFLNPLGPTSIDIHRNEASQTVRMLRQVSRLTARSCTGIQYSHPRLRI